MNDIDNEKIEVVMTRKELKLIADALKGQLVRENSMNFDYLNRITELGKYIDECLRGE